MIKLNISFLEILKEIILTNNKTKHFYNVIYSHSKYTLDEILKGILYVLKTGLSWRDVRSNIKWQSLYWHFNRLSSNGIFRKLFMCLRKGYINNHPIDIQLIDSTFVMNKFGKNHITRNKFFKNKNCNKVSFITDVCGIPLSVLIKPGSVHDITFVNEHLDDLSVCNKKCHSEKIHLLADKGYVSANLKETLIEKKYNFVYPTKKNMKPNPEFDKILYKKRIFVEHSFQKFKLFKRVAIRVDSFLEHFSSFVFLACSMMIHRKIFH
jgi:transposase